MNIHKINPFNPGSPVPPGIFAGRSQQLHEISSCIYQTAMFNSRNIIIVGERGIGKTSIAMVAKAIAENKISSKRYPLKKALLAVNVSVQEKIPSEVVIAQIIKELDLVVTPNLANVTNVLKDFFKSFSELKIFGAGYTVKDKNPNSQEIYLAAEKYIRNLAKLLKKDKKFNAICIILDELDKMGDFESFSSFWKVLQEQLAFDDCRNLMLILSGMPKILESLSKSHESFLRTFFPIELDKMPDDEAKMIIAKALEKGQPQKTMSNEAIDQILFYSENYPHLIQELGYSSFEASIQSEITKDDVLNGLHGNGLYEGSIEKLGKLFFSKMYNEVRKNHNYKEVLKIIADLSKGEGQWVSRKEILDRSKIKKTSLGAALSDLCNKELIIKNPDKTGNYKIQSNMFQVYISKIFQG